MAASDHTWRARDGFEIAIHRAQPESGGPFPALIVFPSIFGITEELAQHVDEIAATGAIAVVFDPFARGSDPGPIEEGGRERAFARMAGLDFEQASSDFRELIAALRDDVDCNGRVLGLGICLGAPFVFSAAADGLLQGVALWHASRLEALVGRAADVKCPVLMDYGDEDPIAPLDKIALIEKACAVIPDCRIRVHAGAGHGFSHTGWDDHRPEVMAQARPDLEKLLASLR